MTKEECKCCAEGRAPQVGGDHYAKLPAQPKDFIRANRLQFFEGCIVKYACRHQDKNGAEDIRKIMEYCQFILDHDYPGE